MDKNKEQLLKSVNDLEKQVVKGKAISTDDTRQEGIRIPVDSEQQEKDLKVVRAARETMLDEPNVHTDKWNSAREVLVDVHDKYNPR